MGVITMKVITMEVITMATIPMMERGIVKVAQVTNMARIAESL